jgi:hypothetical protein
MPYPTQKSPLAELVALAPQVILANSAQAVAALSQSTPDGADRIRKPPRHCRRRPHSQRRFIAM